VAQALTGAPEWKERLKDTRKTNLNAYLFANLVIVGVLLIGIWNRKPVWDVNLRLPNLLLILVLINTILLFRETLFGTPAKSLKSARKRRKSSGHSLKELRAVVKNADKIDEKLLDKVLEKLQKLAGSETAALYSIEGNQCRQLAQAGEMPPALSGSRFILKNNILSIRYSGNLGEESIGEPTDKAAAIGFKSMITRLETTILPLQSPTGQTAICVFSSRENHKAPNLPLASTALFLETLLSLIEKAGSSGDGRYKDKSTGLLLHDCFADSFETEIERSERYKQEMSLLSIKIDGYNSLEDGEKQLVGKNAAIALKNSLRRLDLMFCGENDGEFAAILTETSIQVADTVARRVQKSFAKQNEKLDFISKHNLKMAIGSATYPTDATHGAGLLEKSLEAAAAAVSSETGIASYSEQSA